MADKSSTKMIGNIAFVVFVLAIIGYALMETSKPSDDPILNRQVDAKGALLAYIDTADGFMAGSRTFEDLRKCVLKEDWDWFQDNNMSLYQQGDFAGISTGIDPTQAGFVARKTIMEMLLEEGPYRKDSVIMSGGESGGTNAEFVVRKKETYPGGHNLYYDVKVRLVKDGKYWKVKDFGGGRAEVENRRAPGDVVEIPQEVAEGKAPAGAPPAENAAAASDTNAAPPQGQATLEDAEVFIQQASQYWRAQQYEPALKAAESAYNIRLSLLGPDHPDTQAVLQMVGAARQQLQAQGAQ